jgi:hypothetical protein
MFIQSFFEKDKKKDDVIDHKKEDKSPYGKCRWNEDEKIDPRGSNCPEYLFFSIFQEMIK